MIRYFLSIREGQTYEAPTAVKLAFGEEEIIVRPDDVLVRPDGHRTLRRVRTGHLRKTEAKDVGAAAFVLAAQQAFPEATVELVYLSDEVSQPLTLSAKELKNRRDKLADFLGAIRLGRFPAEPSVRTCPGCPAFFVCGPTPPGVLQKKFE